ncbi:MAG: hypothetical protein ABI192_07270 [Bradyrhizobium sp.]
MIGALIDHLTRGIDILDFGDRHDGRLALAFPFTRSLGLALPNRTGAENGGGNQDEADGSSLCRLFHWDQVPFRICWWSSLVASSGNAALRSRDLSATTGPRISSASLRAARHPGHVVLIIAAFSLAMISFGAFIPEFSFVVIVELLAMKSRRFQIRLRDLAARYARALQEKPALSK